MNRCHENENVLNECLEYFQQNHALTRLLEGFRDKYGSYGRIGGRVILKRLSPSDIEELEGFFGKSFHGQKSVNVTADKFRKALESSRFGVVAPEKLLEAFFEEPLIGKKEQKLRREEEKQRIMHEFEKTYNGTAAGERLQELTDILRDSEKCSLLEWKELLWHSADIYNYLPYRRDDGNGSMYLAVFAAKLTGNPHAFDNGTKGGAFLYRVIQMDLKIRGIKIEASDIFAAYRRKRSYLAVGLLLDDISNYAMLSGVEAIKKNGEADAGMSGFAKECHMVQVPLAVITQWSAIKCPTDEIYIVENPSVFAMLCAKDSRKSYMCMNGQPNLASLFVMELLAKSGTIVYYSGDLDPEGLLIAQKLSGHYKGKFCYVHMEKTDYEKCRSGEAISPKRMKILDKICDERLKPVADEIRKYKTAGYQELLWDL